MTRHETLPTLIAAFTVEYVRVGKRKGFAVVKLSPRLIEAGIDCQANTIDGVEFLVPRTWAEKLEIGDVVLSGLKLTGPA